MKGRSRGSIAKGDEPPGAKEGSGKVHEGDMEDVKLKDGGAAKKKKHHRREHKVAEERKEKKRRDHRARGGGVGSDTKPLSSAARVTGNPTPVKTDKEDD